MINTENSYKLSSCKINYSQDKADWSAVSKDTEVTLIYQVVINIRGYFSFRYANIFDVSLLMSER